MELQTSTATPYETKTYQNQSTFTFRTTEGGVWGDRHTRTLLDGRMTTFPILSLYIPRQVGNHCDFFNLPLIALLVGGG